MVFGAAGSVAVAMAILLRERSGKWLVSFRLRPDTLNSTDLTARAAMQREANPNHRNAHLWLGLREKRYGIR